MRNRFLLITLFVLTAVYLTLSLGNNNSIIATPKNYKFASSNNVNPASNPNPNGQGGNWNMIFNDEFSNTSLDLTKWTPNWFGANNASITVPVNSGVYNCFDPARDIESGGELDITAISSSCTVGSNTYPYRSGMISSNGKFSFTYGYMEARVWMPGTTGTWPAAWSDGQNWPMDGEIDALETWGNGDQEYHYHYGNSNTSYGPGGGTTVSGAFSGWHTYATDWEPGVIKWYYDGNLVWTLTNADLTSGYSITSSPQYLILFLQLDSNSSTVPTTMKIDYVRVWQEVVPTPTPTPTPSPTPSLPIPVSNATPTAQYGSTINLSGTKNSSITTIYINSSSTGVTYPDSTHWAYNNFPLSSGANSISIYGTDGSGDFSPTLVLNINRNKMGDINGDNSINLTDFSIFATDWQHSGGAIINPLSDMNSDGIVDLTDLSIFASTYGT